MKRPVIFFFGKCQSEWLALLMTRIPAVADQFEIMTSRFQWDGTGFTHQSPIAEDLWSRAAFMFVQVIPGLDQTPFLERVPRSCRVLRYPALALRPVWPLHRENPQGGTQRKVWEHFIPFHDLLGVRLSRQNLSPGEAMRRYLETDLSGLVDLDRLAEVHFHECRNIDVLSDIQVTPFIERHWQTEQLFLDLAHPSNTLIYKILSHLKACVLDDPFLAGEPEPLERFNFCQETEVPVHPQVAEHFRLRWAFPGRKYFMLDAFMTFEEYLERAFEPVLSRPIRGRLAHLGRPRAEQAARQGDPIEAAWILSRQCHGRWDLEAMTLLEVALARMDPQQFAECCLAARGIPYSHFQKDPVPFVDGPSSRIERAEAAAAKGETLKARRILEAGIRNFPGSDALRNSLAGLQGPAPMRCGIPGKTAWVARAERARTEGRRRDAVRWLTAGMLRQPGGQILERLVESLGDLQPSERMPAYLEANSDAQRTGAKQPPNL